MDYLPSLRAALIEAADPERAPGMRAYMKSEMPYHGVSAVPARAIFKQVFKDAAFADHAEWEAAVRGLWDGALFREERYGATALADHKAARRFQTPEALPLYEHMIVTGAWWDHVDTLAVHLVGPILGAHPEVMKARMLEWARSDDMWKRRTAIICQVGSKREIDLDLLAKAIEPALGSKEFFLRKAIGWALRQHAWLDPDWVEAYVHAHDAKLSGLSKREALKHIKR